MSQSAGEKKHRFRFGEVVLVCVPDGTTRVGRIVGREPGEHLGRKYGGPFEGIVYHVELELSVDELPRRVIVQERRLRRLHEQQ